MGALTKVGAYVLVALGVLLVLMGVWAAVHREPYYEAPALVVPAGSRQPVYVARGSTIVIEGYSFMDCPQGRVRIVADNGVVLWESSSLASTREVSIRVPCQSGECVYYVEAVAPSCRGSARLSIHVYTRNTAQAAAWLAAGAILLALGYILDREAAKQTAESARTSTPKTPPATMTASQSWGGRVWR